MTKIAHYTALCLSPLLLGGCEAFFAPGAPPAPPLPTAPAAPAAAAVAPLSITDIPALQSINEQGLWLQALAALAPTHSSRDFTKNFAAELGTTYKSNHDAALKLAKTANLSLPTALNNADQARVTRLSHLYYRSFDRALFEEVLRPLPSQMRQQVEQAQKAGSTADLKALAGGFLQAQATMRQKARDLIKY